MAKKKKGIKDRCRRCGLCCLVYNFDKDKYQYCPYLLHYKNKKTRCMIYSHRIGVINGYQQACTTRDKLTFNFPGCPYNRTNLDMHPHYTQPL